MTTNNFSNFVTPPDILQDQDTVHTVLIIDADWIDVDAVAMFCKTSDEQFNVYLYSSDLNDITWLNKVYALANAVIINTDPSPISGMKDRWAEGKKSWYYGTKRFLKNQEHNIKKPIEYFSNLTK